VTHWQLQEIHLNALKEAGIMKFESDNEHINKLDNEIVIDRGHSSGERNAVKFISSLSEVEKGMRL
jgi:hypothetical protein